MTGIGSSHNKFESCRNCPDRTVEPNCHETCRGYIFRQKQQEKIRKSKQAEYELWGFRHDRTKK